MEEEILIIIDELRETIHGSIPIFTMGNCYQFYEILKSIFPSAIAYYDGNHIWTKIEDNYYDIRGKLTRESYKRYHPSGDYLMTFNNPKNILDEDRIISLQQNKHLIKDILNYIEEVYKPYIKSRKNAK